MKRIAFVLLTLSAVAADWPGWRGPTGQGISEEKELPLTWGGPQKENVLWKAPLPGTEGKAKQDQNQSSPIVSAGRVFVTSSYWPAGGDNQAYPEHHVACFQASDGKPLWDVQVKPGPWLLKDLRGGYTAPTPAADGERVYVLFGSSVLEALDYQGKKVWRKEITPYNFDVALGASPVLFGDTVIVQCDQVNKSSLLLALDRKTGAVAWEQKRPDVQFAHSTPVLVQLQGKPQLLVAASNALQGVDPANGKVLWSSKAKGDTVSPVLGSGVVYLDSGRGGAGFAIEPATGDGKSGQLKWQDDKVPEGFSSPVVVGAYLYRLHSPGMLRCYKLASGEMVFDERLQGVSTAVSPFTTPDGRIYLASAGKSFVLREGPKLEILGSSDLGDGSNASPAVAGGRIYLRGRQFLWCIGKK